MRFLDKFNNPKNIRFECFYYTLDLCRQNNFRNIVETGTSRGKKRFFFFNKYNWKDGMSTIMFAEYAKEFNGKLYTCDISADNIKAAKKFTKNYSNHISYFIEDSVLFLKNFSNQIDLLYLDSLDGHNPELASEHQLNEAKAALTKLHDKSLILLDDKGSKTNLSINFLLNNKFKIVFETNFQVLLSKY